MSLSFISFLPGFDRSLKSMKAECAYLACHNKQLMRTIPGSRPGIRVGTEWYCCVDCFALASRIPLSMLASRRMAETARNPRLSLGLVMLSKGILNAEELGRATGHAHRTDEQVAGAVVRLGLATEKQVASARAAQWGYPVLAQDYAGQPLLSDLPRSVLEAGGAVPLHESAAAKRIVLGFVSRVELGLLDAIEQMTGCRTEPCFITPTEFAGQMERLEKRPECEEIVVAEPEAPEAMARAVGRAAVDVGAREANFTQFKNLVWARMTGRHGLVDVVFRVRRATAERPAARFAQSEETLTAAD